MCGVTGIFHYASPERPVDRDELTRMTRALAHRGPDEEGFFVDRGLGLGHRRLSIVDLSPTGRQPMMAPDGSVLSYNGEAYNHRAFRPRLEARGARFAGSADTETLLHLLRLEGPRALSDVAGIFGIAFWDARRRRLVLARDPLGVKQIYYHDDGRRVVFASEIKALLECAGVERAVDPTAVNEYLHFHAPLFERTFFRGIRQVCAGEYVEWNEAGPWTRTYWQIDGFSPDGTDPEARVAELEQKLEEVVGDQLMSDVPVGAFFSGGIDSTAVAAYAKDAGRSLPCFGVHFTGQGVVDERPFQEAAAKALGLELELVTFDGRDFPTDIARLMYFQDQPVIGAAIFPMFHVAGLAARRVKVCLGGQAADEIFGGYARYALADPARVLGSWFQGRRAVHGGPGEGGSRVGGNLAKQLVDGRNLRRLATALPTAMDWKSRYFGHFAKVPASAWSALLEGDGWFDRPRAFEQFSSGVEAAAASDPVSRILHWEMRTYLAALFQQDDRMTMAHSLESRVPLADPRLVRFAMHTPPELKLRGGATKWILRQAVANRIPADVLNRRKAGFDTPAEAWMRDEHRGFVRDTLLSKRARERGIVNPAAVDRLIDDVRRPYWFDLVWKLFCIEVWARVFLDGETPSGIDRGPAR